jgi:hypothetical protein
MNKKKDTEAYWTKVAADLFVGRTIKRARYLDNMGWSWSGA